MQSYQSFSLLSSSSFTKMSPKINKIRVWILIFLCFLRFLRTENTLIQKFSWMNFNQFSSNQIYLHERESYNHFRFIYIIDLLTKLLNYDNLIKKLLNLIFNKFNIKKNIISSQLFHEEVNIKFISFYFFNNLTYQRKKTIALFLKNIFRTKNEAYICGLTILGKNRHKKGIHVFERLFKTKNWSVITLLTIPQAPHYVPSPCLGKKVTLTPYVLFCLVKVKFKP